MATRYFTIFPDDCECDGRSGGCGVVMGRRGGVVWRWGGGEGVD